MNSYDKITSFRKEIAKQLYDEGVQQRTQINSKFTPTLTVLTGEISGIIWLVLKTINSISESITLHQLCTFLFVAITAMLYFGAVGCFLLCFTNYEFSYPSPKETKSFIKENMQCLGDYSEDEILENIINNISDEYMDMAIKNNFEITKHTNYLNKCYIFIGATLMCMIFSFVLVVLL